jgi:hypothetical protein
MTDVICNICKKHFSAPWRLRFHKRDKHYGKHIVDYLNPINSILVTINSDNIDINIPTNDDIRKLINLYPEIDLHIKNY